MAAASKICNIQWLIPGSALGNHELINNYGRRGTETILLHPKAQQRCQLHHREMWKSNLDVTSTSRNWNLTMVPHFINK